MVVAYDEACLRGHGVPQLIDILIREILHAQPTSPSAVVETLLHSLTRRSTITEYYGAVEKKYNRLMEVVDTCPHYGMFQGNEVFYFAKPRADGGMQEMFPGGSQVRVTPSTYSHFIALRNHLDSSQDNVTSHTVGAMQAIHGADAFRGLPPLELLPLSPRLHLLSGSYAPILKLIETIVSIAAIAPHGPNSTKTSATTKLQRCWDDFNLIYAVPFHSMHHDLIPNGSSTRVPFAEASKFIELANDKLSELNFEVRKRSTALPIPTPPTSSSSHQPPRSPVPAPPQGGSSSMLRFSARRQSHNNDGSINPVVHRTGSARLRAVGICSPDGDLPATFIDGVPISNFPTDTSTWNSTTELNSKSISDEYIRLVKGFLDESMEVADFLEIGVTFCIPLNDGGKYELVPEGRKIKVPFSERREYVRRVFVEKRRVEAETIRDLIKHGGVTVASSMSPTEGSFRSGVVSGIHHRRSPRNASTSINVRMSNSLSFSHHRVTNPVTSKSSSFIQNNHFGHSRSISSIPLSTHQVDALRGFLAHLESLRGMNALTERQWDSFHMAYCIKLPGGVSFDLLPDGRKVPVELVDKETFIDLAEDKAITIINDQEERRKLKDRASAASSPRRLLYHSSEGSPASPSSHTESEAEKDRGMFSPKSDMLIDDDEEEDNDGPVRHIIQPSTLFKVGSDDESNDAVVAGSAEMFSRGSADDNSPSSQRVGGMSSSAKRSSGSIPGAAARAFAASKLGGNNSSSSRKSSVVQVQPMAGDAAWVLQQSMNDGGHHLMRAEVTTEGAAAAATSTTTTQDTNDSIAPLLGVSCPGSTLSNTRRPTSSLDANNNNAPSGDNTAVAAIYPAVREPEYNAAEEL